MAQLADVLHVVEACAPGDVGQVAQLTRLPGYRHSVVCIGASSAVQTPAQTLGSGPSAVWRWVRLLRALRPRIVHTHTASALYLQSVAACAGVRARVHTVHHESALQARCLLSLKRWREFTQHYVAGTRRIEKLLQHRAELEPGRISQIYGALEARIQPPLRERRHEHFTVAAFEHGAQLTVLHAWQRLLRDAPVLTARIQLILWLPEGERQSAQSFVEQHQLGASVRQAQSTEQFWQAATQADVFVDHCRRLDLAAEAQAMSLALPIVGCYADEPLASELLLPGQTGESVRANDSVALAQTLREFAQRPQKAQAQGRAARLRLAQHFSLESMHNRYAALYEMLLARGGLATPMHSAHG